MTTHTADVKFIASDSWKTRTKSYMFRWYFKLLVNRTWFRVWLAYCHFFNGLNYLVMMSCGAVKLPAGKGDSFCTNWAAGRFGPQPAGPMRARQGGIAKMKLEMPRSFTDHPLSRKVEHLKSYAKILYILWKWFLYDAIGRYGYCPKMRACMMPKCSSCKFDDNVDLPSGNYLPSILHCRISVFASVAFSSGC